MRSWSASSSDPGRGRRLAVPWRRQHRVSSARYFHSPVPGKRNQGTPLRPIPAVPAPDAQQQLDAVLLAGPHPRGSSGPPTEPKAVLRCDDRRHEAWLLSDILHPSRREHGRCACCALAGTSSLHRASRIRRRRNGVSRLRKATTWRPDGAAAT